MRTDRKLSIRIFSAWLILAISMTFAFGQTGSSKSISDLTNEINQLWPDNNTGFITPYNSRQTLLDIVNSYFNNITIQRIITTPGTVTVGNSDATIILNKPMPSVTPVTLPSVSSRNGLVLEIYDWAGNAGDITITPNGSETIMGLPSWTVGSSGGLGLGGTIKLTPSIAIGGWLVR